MSSGPINDSKTAAAAEARALLTAGGAAALATIDRQTGAPYVSLVTVAARGDRTPILLLSALAQHSQNIAADRRASLLYSAAPGDTDPLTLARVTVTGSIARVEDQAARAAFLERHPGAGEYASFGDFAFFQLNIEAAHFIGGFGRIVKLSRSDLLAP
jgi:heme iron utilization protein